MRCPRDLALFTRRCRLHAPNESDFPHIWSASRVAGFTDGMRWDLPADMADLEAPLERNRESWAGDQAYQFTIENRTDGRFIGRIVIRRIPVPHVRNIGFWVHPREQGRGYVTEAATRILKFGFETLGATRIEADHAVWNTASERVLLKIGMTFLEHLPQGFQKQGCWVPENHLAITREIWALRHAREVDANEATPPALDHP